MKILRKIFGGISLTAAMFVFQACYGTMPSSEMVDVDEIVDSLEDEAIVDADNAAETDLVMTEADNVEQGI